jgi:hypothetical protein
MGLVAEMRPGLEQLLHGDDGGRQYLSPSGSTSMEQVTGHSAGTGMCAPPVGWRRP